MTHPLIGGQQLLLLSRQTKSYLPKILAELRFIETRRFATSVARDHE